MLVDYMATRTTPTSGSIARPSPLACVECRSKHLKCDSRQPVCSRCAASDAACNYTPSRRGCKGIPKKRRKLNSPRTRDTPSLPSAQPAPTDIHPISDGLNWQHALTPFAQRNTATASTSSKLPLQASLVSDTPSFTSGNQTLAPAPTISQSRDDSPQGLDEEHVLNLYYSNFHPAHPVLMPRSLFDGAYPTYLQLVVRFIGSHYSVSQSGDSLRWQTATALKNQLQRTPFMVQARLLFAIALHARNEPNEAMTVLSDAIDLAISLGMNTREFASLNSGGLPCMEESLRRTWWELFVVEGIMSAAHRKPFMKTTTVASETLLPCENSTYSEGACFSGSFSPSQFTDRHFADEDIEFSSSCYRIEAVQILSRVLAIANVEAHPDEVQAIDNSLAAWTHYVPPEKRDLISNSGEVDEMLFQARMVIHWATILLHMPRSELLAVHPAASDIFCAKGDRQMPSTDTKHAHASKATDASKELSNLAALRCPVQKHTPFFICGLVLASVVQLAACTLHNCRCMYQHRDRITLVVGLLKSLGQTWACAASVLVKIKKIAAKVLRPNSTNTPSTVGGKEQCDVRTDSGIGTSNGADEVPWLDFFDDPGVGGFERFIPGSMFSDESGGQGC